MKKRGQIDSHILVYALTIAIVGIVIVMGYRFISQSGKVMDKSELLQFKSKLASDIKVIGNDYGAFKKITYTLPKNLQEVCFADISKKSDILSSKLIEFYPIIKDSISSNEGDNVFFIGEWDEQSFSIPNAAINHYPFMNCFHQDKGRIEIGIEGLGGGNSLILAEFLTKANINPNDKVVLQSADHVITLEIPKGTTSNIVSISIEMVEPLSSYGISDTYRFGPAGTTFSNPIKLIIKYDPNAAGDCPSKLVFSQFNEDGGNKISVESKSIDCENKIAYFEIDRFV